MAKKRLSFDVEESLHSELKARAAGQGVTLGALCSSLLSSEPDEMGAKIDKREPLDPSLYPNVGLKELRDEIQLLGRNRPEGWNLLIRKINAEITRRYKIS